MTKNIKIQTSSLKLIKNQEISDDIWTAESLNIRTNLHAHHNKLNFSHIEQDWLKEAAKVFISYMASTKEFDIKDASGKLWNFQTHQFRHTVGTRMINNGVPQHIIQRYLGHESPTMTSVYAHIYDKTLKQEIAKYHDSRVVNVAGEVVESTTPELDNDLDLHFLKKKVLAQSLPNGSCARPIVLGECPHANACLTCGDFRTTIEFLDQHKTQLEETEKLVKNAEDKGWKRHAEMNTKVKDNLKKIITTLESGNKDIVSGGGD